MKVLIMGGGFIGKLLKQYLKNADIDERRISGPEGIDFSDYDVVVNAIAKTDIDWCEKNKNECFYSNVLVATHLARLCKEQGKRYVFLSSACVFESKNGEVYAEDHKPNPACFYTETKVIAEKLIQEILPSTLIIRMRLPITSVSHLRNLLNKLLSYDKLNDNQESVTVLEDALPTLKGLMEANATGIYHLVNRGTISPAEIGKKLGHKFRIVTKEAQDKRLEREGRAKRVTTYGISKRGVTLPQIKERIDEIIKVFKGVNI